MKKLLRIAVCW